MRSPDELDALCLAVRTPRTRPATDELMAIAAEEFEALCAAVPEPLPQLPPETLVEPLWSFGWLLYEISWALTSEVKAGYEALPPDAAASSVEATARIDDLAEMARDVPWPEFAPRALGALRSQALAHSKRDTTQGFDLAWSYHEDANRLHDIYLKSHVKDSRYAKALRETMIQLWLSQAGTSCRTAEQMVGRWAESVRDGSIDAADQDRVVQSTFDRLWRGVEFGERALAAAMDIRGTDEGLAYTVTRDHLALVTAFRNPGIMAARAALLVLPFSVIMEEFGRSAPEGHESWARAREVMLERMKISYAKIEDPVVNQKNEPVDLVLDHKRSIVQIRLNLALIMPGETLRSRVDFDDCLERSVLDDQAVAALSGWLAHETDGTRRGDANVIGSATMPRFVEGVEKLRAAHGASGGYREWRRDWFNLDRYSGEDDRADLVASALGISVPGSSSS